ncbi:hypothetical protein EKO04_000145 [Ascochyta lentis]|uniref:Uncharacterized protein n=1 Tax=Ascochyta lentis TaxID=205686 RepID=A0A8H7JC93_9PLEO|nr:hypothetical protein EKO04_000145 [Ascochyta lentis]
MPKFSRFYSATEAEALASISRLFPQSVERAPQSINSDAEQLSNMINGNVDFSPRPRNDINQPIFECTPPVQPVEQLLKLSGFSISYDTIHRDKMVRYASSSEGSREWKTRSRTPSSDEPFPSPSSSVKAETSGTSNGSPEDDLAQVIAPSPKKRENNWNLYPDYYATYPQDVLQGMDTQFSKFTYDLHEGSTAIPFVMAQAPAKTHAKLVAVDRKLWTSDDGHVVEDSVDNDAAAVFVLERFQKTDRQRATSNRRALQAKNDGSDHRHESHNDKPTSKRAALIARSQATKDSSLVIIRRQEQKTTPEPPIEQTKPTILILNQKEDDQRRDVDSALQNNGIDLDDTQQLQELMRKLGKAMTEQDKASEGQVVEKIEEVDLDGAADRASKVHRLKGKARKDAKRRAT